MRSIFDFILAGLVLPFRPVEELSGEGWWYRRKCKEMETERPPLTGEEYLRRLAVDSEEH